jgi:hypothetical protein
MSHHVFWWTCTDISEGPAAFLVMDRVRTFEMWVHSYNTKMCHIPEDSSTHCNCWRNLTSYNTSVECWYSCLWFHISRAQGWIIQIKEFKKIYKLPGDLWVKIIWLEMCLRFYIFLIQPVLIVGTSIICHSLLYIHAFACLTILCTCFVYCILCVFCTIYWSSEYYWFFSFNVL